MSKFDIEVETFSRVRSNTLFGKITILIPALHLRIQDATVHESHRRRWVGLPARPQIDRDGVARRDDHNKIAYSAILQFTDRATADAFSARVIAALLESFPDAFAADGGAS